MGIVSIMRTLPPVLRQTLQVEPEPPLCIYTPSGAGRRKGCHRNQPGSRIPGNASLPWEPCSYSNWPLWCRWIPSCGTGADAGKLGWQACRPLPPPRTAGTANGRGKTRELKSKNARKDRRYCNWTLFYGKLYIWAQLTHQTCVFIIINSHLTPTNGYMCILLISK